MKNPVPLQFLVGLTRLIAIYFCIRGIDQLSGAIVSYQMMISMTMPESFEIPDTWSVYLPAISILFATAIAVWFAAPFVCRIAIPGKPADEGNPTPETYWDAVMIFLVGVLFVGVGITRISALLITIATVDIQRGIELGYDPSLADKTNLVATVILIGFGVILMKRFPSIHRWIGRKMQA